MLQLEWREVVQKLWNKHPEVSNKGGGTIEFIHINTRITF